MTACRPFKFHTGKGEDRERDFDAQMRERLFSNRRVCLGYSAASVSRGGRLMPNGPGSQATSSGWRCTSMAPIGNRIGRASFKI